MHNDGKVQTAKRKNMHCGRLVMESISAFRFENAATQHQVGPTKV